jgi:hypothetical protein
MWWFKASALFNLRSAFCAGDSVLFVSLAFSDRLWGSRDRRSDLVDAIVDTDLVDAVSFSDVLLGPRRLVGGMIGVFS